MAYEKLTWTDDESVITASKQNHQEAGIEGAHTLAQQALDEVAELEIPDIVQSLQEAASGNQYRLVAGAIRKKGGEWALIDDEGHTPSGIVSVTDRGADLRIHYGFTAKKVVSLVAVPDESYAVLGYSFGASVGLDGATIKIMNHRQVNAGGYLYYTADGWMMATGNLDEVADRPKAHEFRVYHPEPVPNDEIYLSITGRGPGKYIYRAEGSGTASDGRGYTNIGIYDMSGNPVTAFKTDMKLFIVRQSQPQTVQIKPETLEEGNTNIWILGLMEV